MRKITFFLVWNSGQDLKKLAAHPHQEFPGPLSPPPRTQTAQLMWQFNLLNHFRLLPAFCRSSYSVVCSSTWLGIKAKAYSRLSITRTFKGNRKKIRVIGSSKNIAESKVKNSFYCTVNILITFNCSLNVKWKLKDTFRLYIRTTNVTKHILNRACVLPFWEEKLLHASLWHSTLASISKVYPRLRVVPHFSSGIVERAKRERAWKSLSLRKNGGLLVV